MIVQDADSLLISGVILSEVWFNLSFPTIEYKSDDIFEKIQSGNSVQVDGATGEIRIKTKVK